MITWRILALIRMYQPIKYRVRTYSDLKHGHQYPQMPNGERCYAVSRHNMNCKPVLVKVSLVLSWNWFKGNYWCIISNGLSTINDGAINWRSDKSRWMNACQKQIDFAKLGNAVHITKFCTCCKWIWLFLATWSLSMNPYNLSTHSL